MRTLIPFLALAACDLPGKPLPSEFPSITPFAACVAPAGGWAKGETWSQAAELRGAVVAVGTGSPVDCARDAYAMSTGGALMADAQWLRLADTETGIEWEVAVVLSSFALPFELGEEVRVTWDFMPPEWSSGVGALSIRDWEDASVLWMAQASALEDIVPPRDVFFARGETIARSEDDCGTVEAYDLDVTVPTDEGTIAWGEAGMVGDLVFHHGGVSDTIESSDTCLDWWAGGATLAAVY